MNVTGNITRLYLSMSEAVIPNILFNSFMSQSGLGGAAGGTAGGGGLPGGGPPPWELFGGSGGSWAGGRGA